MDDLRIVAAAGLEAIFAEHFAHGDILWQDVCRKFLEASGTRQARQMPRQHRSDPLPLISIDHDKGDLKFQGIWFGGVLRY